MCLQLVARVNPIPREQLLEGVPLFSVLCLAEILLLSLEFGECVSLDFLCYHLHQMSVPISNRPNSHVSQHQCAGLTERSGDLIREFRD